MAQAQAPSRVEAVREGSRWIYAKPSGEEVADWFEKNVVLHEGMDPKKYVGGIVLIGQKERMSETRRAANGSTQIVEGVEHLTFTPYAKVETRVAYFWDYMDLHPEWVAAIEPVATAALSTDGYFNENLPAGFFRMPVKGEKGVTHYLGCSARVRIFAEAQFRPGATGVGGARRATDAQITGKLVREYPAGTKLVPLLDRYGRPDSNAFMKAETGAIGRALGMAGMLVIPGSGVATAEDMVENQQTTAIQEEPSLPDVATAAVGGEADNGQDSRQAIIEGLAVLESEAPDSYEKIVTWASGRKIDLDDLKDTQLRGVLRQVERALGAMSDETA